MKRLICILLSLGMVFVVAACGGNSSAGGSSVASEAPGQEPSAVESNEAAVSSEEEPAPPQEEREAVRASNTQTYFFCPEGWNAEKGNRTTLIFQSEKCLVSIASRSTSEFAGELEDLIPFMEGIFSDDAYSYSEGSIHNYPIVVTNTERVTIAGYDCVRYTGTISNAEKWDCHVYGYAFLVEDRAIMVTGLVSAREQDPDMIAEINAITDEIMESIHTKE